MKKFWVFFGIMPVICMVILLTVGFGATTAAAPGQTTGATDYYFPVITGAPDPNETLSLVNAEREAYGLTKVRADERLGAVARARAEDMVERGYYAHRNPDGKYYYNYFSDYDINTGFNCENLDLVFVPSEELVINEWKASLKGHRGCMMHKDVTAAGYATAKLTLTDFQGNQTIAYLVVAIHASL